MTIQQQNEEIAKMIGWKLVSNGFYYQWLKPNEEKVSTLKPLLFHKNANWQFEAMEWLDNKGYGLSSYNYSASITEDDSWTINTQGEDRKEAIFKCLFEVSQYLKNL